MYHHICYQTTSEAVYGHYPFYLHSQKWVISCQHYVSTISILRTSAASSRGGYQIVSCHVHVRILSTLIQPV